MRRWELWVAVLLPDYWLVNETFPEDRPLVCPFEAFFNHHTRHTDRSATHDPALVVEVGHDDGETLVFLPKEVVERDFDIVKSDECCASGGGVRRFDLLASVSVRRSAVIAESIIPLFLHPRHARSAAH